MEKINGIFNFWSSYCSINLVDSAIIQFCRTNKENIEKRKALKKEIIICSIIIVAWIVIIGGFIFLLMRSIAINGM